MKQLGPMERLWACMFLVGFVGLMALPDKVLMFGFLIVLIVLWFPMTIFGGEKGARGVKQVLNRLWEGCSAWP